MAAFGLLGMHGAFMQNLLDLRQKRQEIIGANIANADTPNYKAKRLDFEEALAESMPKEGEMTLARTSASHLPTPYGAYAPGEVQAVETPIPKGDGNSVDQEQEMAQMAANQLLYNFAAQSVSGQINKLRMVIQGGQGG